MGNDFDVGCKAIVEVSAVALWIALTLDVKTNLLHDDVRY